MMSQESKEDGCGHKSEREEAFHTVSLTVKNKGSLKDSLELYVKCDILDGDNKWQCGKCDSKRAALKRSCFGKLPKYLMLHLSRFGFDFNAMRRKKLIWKSIPKRGTSQEKKEEILVSHPMEYYEYDLVGTVIHTGGAEAGHYYSYAQSSDGK